jgi:hypothetical protein
MTEAEALTEMWHSTTVLLMNVISALSEDGRLSGPRGHGTAAELKKLAEFLEGPPRPLSALSDQLAPALNALSILVARRAD